LNRLRTHYDNLKVSRDAPDFVIRAAYKTLTQKYHPDKNPSADAARIMQLINRS
jgi:DnaJ-class molecular chaperone